MKTEVLIIRLTKAQKENILKLAELNEVSMSQYILMSIKEFEDQEGDNKWATISTIYAEMSLLLIS